MEYGKRSLRWTRDAHAWGERISVPEHEDLGTKPVDLLHIVVPGGSAMHGDLFIGVVAASLIGVAIWCAFERREVRLFSVLGAGALLYSMPRNDVLYGFFYALVPMVEKAREPLMAISIFHLCAAVLAAIGASVVQQGLEPWRSRLVTRSLVWFGAVTLGLFYLTLYLRPTLSSHIVDGDPRVGVIALLGMMAAAVYRTSERGHLSNAAAVALLAVLIIIEQGNEATWPWIHKDDREHAVFLKQLSETRDVADFLARQPKPLRVEWNHKDVPFSFGDWNRLEAIDASVASVPASLQRLSPWADRTAQLYGVGYTIAKASTRPGQREVFSDPAGYKVFQNPAALPRAWTVHHILFTPDERSAVTQVSEGGLDLRSAVAMTGKAPPLATCAGADETRSIEERPSSVTIKVRMACKGLLVVSDNWFPGWHASVDGRSSSIWLVDTAIRGVVVETGEHEIVMTYRPWSVYSGLIMLLIGLGSVIWLAYTKEADGFDVLAGARLPLMVD